MTAPHFASIFDAFAAAAEAAPDNAFLAVPPRAGRHYHADGFEITYGAARTETAALADLYRRSGYGPGHRIGLLLENRPDYLLHMLALNALGVSVVPVNPDYAHGELIYLMDHSECDLVVSIPDRVASIEAAGAGRDKPLPVITFDTLPETLPAPPKAAEPGQPETGTEALLLYTSGTTGRPKGCIITNHYGLNSGAWYQNFGGRLSIEPDRERLYNPLPLFHMNAGIVSFVCMLLARGCQILPDRFHPSTWWEEIVATRATVIHYLGIVPPVLINQPVSEAESRHTVKFGLGAGIEPELHAQVEERFGFPFVEVWGMTETGRIFADAFEPRQVETRAFGRPNDAMQARVVDDDDNDVARGQEGELLVRAHGPDPRAGFFAGYLKNSEATEDAWRGGWFHTGDVVRQSADGMLYFVDRKKNIIRRSGENIAAAEIEAALQAHDAVAQIAVIAAPDELRDEEVMACIVPMPGFEPGAVLARRLFDYCMGELAYYKAPGWVLFVDRLPTTGTQKVQKTEIFAAGVDPREQPGIIDMRSAKRRKT